MPRTYEPIASTTLGSSTATVTFDNIAGTWTDLIVVGRFGMINNDATELYVRFNSDSGTNYSHTALFGGGTSAASNRASSASLGILVSTSDTAGNSVFCCSVASYANTNVNKTVLSAYASPGRDVGRTVGLWRSTSAITRIDISRNSAGKDITSGSTFAVYGIKAA